jgi:hypothetical protein
MAIRNTLLGGTDWSDGQVLIAEDLNDTMDAVAGAIRIKTYTSSSASTSSATFIDTGKNFTLSANGGALLSLYWQYKLGGGGCIPRIKISGSNLGTYYIQMTTNIMSAAGAAQGGDAFVIRKSTDDQTVWDVTGAQDGTAGYSYTAYLCGGHVTANLPLIDDTTTVTLELRSSTGGVQTVSNYVARCVYVKSATSE